MYYAVMRVIFRMLRNRVSFDELIRYLYSETPPQDHNYLAYDYAHRIKKISRFNMNQTTKPLFSVIIPTCNRYKLLVSTLRAVVSQKDILGNKFEIIIVDNGSTDKTEETVTYFARLQKKTEIIYVKLKKNYGADFARNAGVLQSQGSLLAFTDDDCLTPKDWLSRFKQSLDSHPGVIGVGGWKEPYSVNGDLDIYHRFAFWTHKFFLPPLKSDSYSLRSGYTANFCCRKESFKKIGGFNLYFQHIGFYDFPVRAYRSGLSIMYEPRMVKHQALFSFKDYFHKSLIMGLDLYLLHLLHPNIWKNISFFSFLRRVGREINMVLSSPKDPLLFRKSPSDIIGFLFLAIVSSFGFWLGKYWLVAFGQFIFHIHNTGVNAQPLK